SPPCPITIVPVVSTPSTSQRKSFTRSNLAERALGTPRGEAPSAKRDKATARSLAARPLFRLDGWGFLFWAKDRLMPGASRRPHALASIAPVTGAYRPRESCSDRRSGLCRGLDVFPQTIHPRRPPRRSGPEPEQIHAAHWNDRRPLPVTAPSASHRR